MAEAAVQIPVSGSSQSISIHRVSVRGSIHARRRRPERNSTRRFFYVFG
ncbi:hypothetical protein HanXRQr2_Chr17g0804181 [Helianthus annuus]|uniref:Uncharacterized protein n=1 Tax=Helianthus annuus TaxID=4232 RepID=A0A9K3GTV8_HELAN|nr:hypothetical protein HanXRQr2_Chr17g0804181 [Helianthus annuus]